MIPSLPTDPELDVSPPGLRYGADPEPVDGRPVLVLGIDGVLNGGRFLHGCQRPLDLAALRARIDAETTAGTAEPSVGETPAGPALRVTTVGRLSRPSRDLGLEAGAHVVALVGDRDAVAAAASLLYRDVQLVPVED